MQIILSKCSRTQSLQFIFYGILQPITLYVPHQQPLNIKSLSKHLPIKFPKKMPISNSFPLIKLPKLYTSHILKTYSYIPHPLKTTHTHTHFPAELCSSDIYFAYTNIGSKYCVRLKVENVEQY